MDFQQKDKACQDKVWMVWILLRNQMASESLTKRTTEDRYDENSD